MKGKGFVNFLAYLAIILIAVALVLGVILARVGISASVVDAMTLVAQVIAYAITAVFAFAFAKGKNIGFMIALIVAVILIVVMLFL